MDNCDIIGSACEMSNLIAKHIDDEKDNDLMEVRTSNDALIIYVQTFSNFTLPCRFRRSPV